MAEIKNPRILQITHFLLLIVLFCPFSSGEVIYVDDDATGANDGSSWTDAYTFLQEALADADSAEKPVEIRVAQGTYKPDQGLGAIPEFDFRTSTFQLINDVTLKGGYTGIGGEDPNARDIRLYQTLLSGDLNGDDGPNFASNSENSYHVATGSGTDDTAVLDGFTITAGNANDSGNTDGGGMINIGSTNGLVQANPTLVNCTFYRNSAGRKGGGIYNEAGTPTLIDCVFRENHSNAPLGPPATSIQLGGGGMYNERGDLTLRNCRFVGNTTTSNGAGLYNNSATPVIIDTAFEGNVVVRFGHQNNGGGILNNRSDTTITNCTFIGNSASFGGGIWSWGPPAPSIFNCIFSRNEAVHPSDGAGGGIQNWGGNPTVINCTFNENTAEGVGGGIGEGNGSRTIVGNCIFWDNRARDRSDANGQIGGGSTVITYSCVQNGRSGEGNIDADPLFADPNNGDYHLKSQIGRWDPNSQSWVVDDVTSPCIDVGDPNSDFSGETWPHGERINMGAYGGTREASMSLETEGLVLPRVAYIFTYNDEMAVSFNSLLGSHGCPTTLIRVADVPTTSLGSYDLIIVADDTLYEDTWSDPNSIASIEDSGKPIVGLGDGGYDFFGLLGLSIGNPYGGHGSKNSIEVVDPNCSLFSTPYSIDIPQDRALHLYTETNSIGIYLWPTIPETVTVFGNEVNDVGYFPLVAEHNRYLLWGFTESPQKMTEVGKTLFINVVIWTANEVWESDK